MYWFLLILIVLYILVLIGLAYIFVYPFRIPLFVSPAYLGCPQEFTEFPDSGTGKLLRAWWVPKDDPEIVMVCGHGYMMNRAELAPYAPRFKDQPIAFLFYDFPAHGSSQGRKSGFGYRERTAVIAAAKEARKRYPNAKIILAGSSMGAAASSFALSENPEIADGLILDSCYDEFADAINGWWLFVGGKTLRFLLYPAGFLGIPLAGLNPYKVVVSKALAKVSQPTLILHGTGDTLAPIRAAEKNYSALLGPKELVTFDGRNHSESRWEEAEKYFDTIELFLIQKGFLSESVK